MYVKFVYMGVCVCTVYIQTEQNRTEQNCLPEALLLYDDELLLLYLEFCVNGGGGVLP
jgi:hypothetical protein